MDAEGNGKKGWKSLMRISWQTLQKNAEDDAEVCDWEAGRKEKRYLYEKIRFSCLCLPVISWQMNAHH